MISILFNYYRRLVIALYSLALNRADKYQHPSINKEMQDLLGNPALMNPKKDGWFDFPDTYLNEVKENASALDKHMIWITGGAVSILILFFDQERLINFEPILSNLLKFSLIILSFCLWCIISSFFAVNRAHVALEKLRKSSFVFTQLITELKTLSKKEQEKIANDHKRSVAMRNDLEFVWNSVRYYLLLVIIAPKMTGVFNVLSYWTFTIGIFSIVCFGILSS